MNKRATQSPTHSFAVFFRAAFMLCCLVAIPMAAVLGKTFPDVVDSLLEGRWPTVKHEAENVASENNSSEEAPRFRPSATAPPSPTNRGLARNDRADASPLFPVEPSVAPTTEQMSSLIHTLGGGQPETTQTGYDRAVRPADYETPVQSPQRLPAPTRVRETSDYQQHAADPLPPAFQFRQLETRLQELGAAHYQLESFWGEYRRMYRFRCNMAIAGNSACTRYFEATGTDPQETMAAVVQQVEQWRMDQVTQLGSAYGTNSINR